MRALGEWAGDVADGVNGLHESLVSGRRYMRVYKIHADLDSELEICISSI